MEFTVSAIWHCPNFTRLGWTSSAGQTDSLMRWSMWAYREGPLCLPIGSNPRVKDLTCLLGTSLQSLPIYILLRYLVGCIFPSSQIVNLFSVNLGNILLFFMGNFCFSLVRASSFFKLSAVFKRYSLKYFSFKKNIFIDYAITVVPFPPPPVTPLHPAHPLPPTLPPYSSCPWVILISSLYSIKCFSFTLLCIQQIVVKKVLNYWLGYPFNLYTSSRDSLGILIELLLVVYSLVWAHCVSSYQWLVG